jgi:hypothetical protein
MPIPLLGQKPVEWYCPNCWVTAWRPLPPPGQATFHTCPGLHMLTAPLIQVGIRCKVEAHEREDWLGREIQNKGDDGKPYMSVTTTRDDGTDTVANAGCAQATLGALREMADE